mmetsp:Transcript_16327/g.14006  ORF Transcript_16327/g.14006 Transcript_16327/m.14006 type:complete len:94 (+) Transcript_16327:1061-1342(+)
MIQEAGSYGLAREPPVGLKNVDTGYCSKAAFGVEIRKVNLMRGGREGNNAFAADIKQILHPDYDKIFDQSISKKALNTIRHSCGDHEVISRIH